MSGVASTTSAPAAPGRGSPAREATALSRRAITWIGIRAALGAALVMGGWLMYAGEVAAVETAVPGVRSSTWTALTSVTSLVFGLDAFHGDFAAPAILFGLAAHFFNAVAAGLLMLPLFVYSLGEHPRALLAAGFGLGSSLMLQVVALNVVMNALQDPNTVYESIPSWAWWVGSAGFGVSYGLLAARGLRRARPEVDAGR